MSNANHIEGRRAILTAVAVAVLLIAEFAFIIFKYRTSRAPEAQATSVSGVTTAIVRDGRFLKLSTAAITAIQVGETGRLNPFEPYAP